MNSEIIPSSDKAFADFHENFTSKLITYAPTLGLSAAETAEVTTDQGSFRTAVREQVTKVNEAQAATANKNAVRSSAERRLRALVRRIKAHPGYTRQMGEALGIERGPAATAQKGSALALGSAAQPQLRSHLSSAGEVAISFRKEGHTGVLLYGRRGRETEWTLLAKQLRSPFVDDRPNMNTGVPETREYQARYLENDQAVGQLSDVLVVTLPAQREAKPLTTQREAA